jgi:hypothetical protein
MEVSEPQYDPVLCTSTITALQLNSGWMMLQMLLPVSS